MKKIFVLAFCAFSLLFSTTLNAQVGTVFINEVLSSNTADSQDSFFEYDDWMELYYLPGESPAVINLAGYFLSDDPTNLTKWTIPATNPGLTTIVTGQHLLFWLDKDPEQGEDHVDFKLSADGESVILTMPDSITIIDQIDLGPQVSDISYGRECDGCENWQFFNNTTPDDVNAEIQPEVQTLYINEVMTVNGSYVDDSEGEYEQWVEIYNPNDFNVNLANYHFTVPDFSSTHEIPNDNPLLTVVPANGFLLFWFDNELNEGENHVNFNLELDGGTIMLTGPFISNVVDEYEYPAIGNNLSYGRQTDGSIVNTQFNIPTPRVSNSLVIIEPENVYINEIMADNFTDTLDNYLELEDWIEIYNPNSYAVDLAGYHLSDNPENPFKYQIATDNPDSTTVPAGGWLLFWADEDGTQGVNHISFRLNNLGEELTLYSPDGFSVADQVSFGPQLDDVSYGRLTDGASTWTGFLETTPEASNNGALIGIDENDIYGAKEINIYPNPIESGQDITWNEFAKYRVLDQSGRVLSDWKLGTSFQTQGLSSGLYFIQFDQFGVNKFIVR